MSMLYSFFKNKLRRSFHVKPRSLLLPSSVLYLTSYSSFYPSCFSPLFSTLVIVIWILCTRTEQNSLYSSVARLNWVISLPICCFCLLSLTIFLSVNSCTYASLNISPFLCTAPLHSSPTYCIYCISFIFIPAVLSSLLPPLYSAIIYAYVIWACLWLKRMVIMCICIFMCLSLCFW